MKHPILITECPKCGEMKAVRTPWLEPKLDAEGQPDPNIGTMMTIECLGCWEPAPRAYPMRELRNYFTPLGSIYMDTRPDPC